MKVRWLLLSPSARLPTCSKRNLTKTGGDANVSSFFCKNRGAKHCHYCSSSLPSLFHPFCPLSSIFHLQRFYPLSSILIHRYSFSSNFINCNPLSSNFIQRYPTGLPWHVNLTKLAILVKLWMCVYVGANKLAVAGDCGWGDMWT